mmetsp:Transcript_16510/g.39869  ORF Transcript_16510/g.39869 Transcript_16510/m.39869 type:complete len:120 (+) Transcript_16510:224-583(+)
MFASLQKGDPSLIDIIGKFCGPEESEESDRSGGQRRWEQAVFGVMAGDRSNDWPSIATLHPNASTAKLKPSFGTIRVLLSSLMITNVRAVSFTTIPLTPTIPGFLALRTATLLPCKSAF